MYALVAICTTLSPGPTDESIMSIVKEHYADQLQILQRGGQESIETYKDLFLSSCPKYLSVNPPPYEDPAALEAFTADPPKDATQRHLELFLSDVAAVDGVSGIRNLLKLYTSIDATKLSAFTTPTGAGAGADEKKVESADSETDILEQLMVLKGASRTYAKSAHEGTPLDGERIITNNLDFTIDGVSQPITSVLMDPMSLQCRVVLVLTTLGNGTRRRDNLAQTVRRILYPKCRTRPESIQHDQSFSIAYKTSSPAGQWLREGFPGEGTGTGEEGGWEWGEKGLAA